MINIAILGTGAISDSHIQAYRAFPDQCRIVALADLYPDKAEAKAKQHDLKVRILRDHQEIASSSDIDAVSICLPPFSHATPTIDLLQADKNVLVEKPMATSLEECDAMIDAARHSGKLLSVVAQNRFKTPMMKLKAILSSQLIGRVLHAQVDSLWWRGSNYYDLWWRGTWEKEGGGCTMNHAVHHIDLFQWILGLPSELRAVSRNLNHDNSEVEDFSTAVLSYPDGCVGQITASLVHHGEEQRMVFQAEHAKVAVPWEVVASKQKENGFPEADAELTRTIQSRYEALPPVSQEGHYGQIANFLDALKGRDHLLIDGAEGRRTLELITGIYQSSHLDRDVRFPLTPKDPFYTRAGIAQHAHHFHEKTKNVENFAQNDITLGRQFNS